VTVLNGRKVHVAPFYNQRGEQVAQHIRTGGKDFPWIGNQKNLQLFGQKLWRDGGKMVVVTEGELDAMSLSQAYGNKWPVVSITGANCGRKEIAHNLEWLSKFETVVLMFDMDEPGQAAAQECALILEPGKVKIAHLPRKDANEMLMANEVKELIDAVWGAKEFRPDGIVAGQDLWELVSEEDNFHTARYPWEPLNVMLRGLRSAELVTVTGGSGIGKSAIVREISYALIEQGESVGMLMLEESVKRTALGMMGLAAMKPLHISKDDVTEEDLRRSFTETLGTGRLFLYDHFGSTGVDNLLAKVRYLARGFGCKWIVLDHLSIIVSGLGDGDERRLIDNAMTALRTLVQELDIGLILVSHLKRPPGDRGHEEGARTSLGQLRGSHAIAQLSDIVIGAERNQQDADNPNQTLLRVLKNRFTGEVGEAGLLLYDQDTGRLESTGDTDNNVGAFGDEEEPLPF
jgi:twinkle protein